jgi:hypothetical protein
MTVSSWTRERACAQPFHRWTAGPEQPVGGSQAWSGRGALENGQLVPQREVLEHQARRVLSMPRRPVRISVIMPAIIDQTDRRFNVFEADFSRQME